MINHFGLEIYHFFRSLEIWGAFLSMFIENIGIPLPTEIGYLISRDLITQGKHSFAFTLSILTLGHVMGSILAYRLGIAGDNYVTRKMKSNIKVIETQKKLHLWYGKYGNLAVFFSRFVGYIRPWSSFVAGFAEVSFWPFVLWTAVGSLIFNIIALYFSGVLVLIWRNFEPYHFIIAAVMFVMFFGFLIYEAVSLFVLRRKK